MADVRLAQLDVQGAVASEVDIQVSGLYVLAGIKFPSESVEGSQLFVQALVTSDMAVRVAQLYVLAAVRSRSDNRKARAWTFSLDGHDFYVIRLGEDTTLVYDLTTERWSEWTSGTDTTWRAQAGLNWVGMTTTYLFSNTSVVAGDDTLGVLWVLDPERGYDETPLGGEETEFTRKVTAFVPKSMRETERVGAVYLTASVGDPQLTGATISLRTSDDAGNSWQDHDTITAASADYSQEFVWRSLGLIKAPGKIFEITDNGASVRLDKLDMR